MKKKRRTYIEPKKQKGKQGRILAVCHLDMIFFVSFFVGILWANFIGDSSKNRFFMLNEYYLQQLKYAKLDYNRLFLYILENRLPLFGVLLLLSFTVVGILIQILFILYFGVSFGFLCVMAITNFGWKGILYMGGFLFPHSIFYIAGSLLFLKIFWKKKEDMAMTQKELVMQTGMIVLLFVIGLLVESYVNPIFLKKMLKIF